MFIFRWWGNVWEIGNGEDYLAMLFIKAILASLVLLVGIALLGFWLGFKVIQWKPVVGVPLVGGILAIFVISAASG